MDARHLWSLLKEKCLPWVKLVNSPCCNPVCESRSGSGVVTNNLLFSVPNPCQRQGMCLSLHGCLAMFFFGNVMGRKVKRLDDFAPCSFFLLAEVFCSIAGLRNLLAETGMPAQSGRILGMYGAHPDSLILETLLILASSLAE